MFKFKLSTVFILGAVVAIASADAPSKIVNVEVLLGQVFVPETGYGTNNNVQLTLDGFLPNSCYQLGKAKIEVGSDPHTLIVHQYADLEEDGVCVAGASFPIQLSTIVPYTYDVDIGHLEAGDYKIIFNQVSNPIVAPRTRLFHVYSSKNMSSDDFPYAAVSTVSMPDVVNGLYNAKATLTGTLTSSCNYISNMKLTNENDVIVVQPILGFKTNTICTQVLLPFSADVDLGKFSEGRYLVHVRAMSGKSVSHAFSIILPDPAIK